ncbi:MAG: ABC transporter substrate-binding protein [Phormidesmis sp. CAN_BIN36]|nr:ABC transporter substrate-binding protein [Phormidesmis sp. CAN_BIN36]
MVSQFNHVTCPNCKHDRNAPTAKKCENCGHRLGKGVGVLPMVGVGLGILALAGAGYVGFKAMSSNKAADASPTPSNSAVASSTASSSGQPQAMTGDVSAFISRGEKVLFTDVPSPDKQAAAAAIAAGDMQTAISKLEAARQSSRNDPETLIYLNNARLGQAATLNVAAVVPATSSPSSAREILRGVAQAQDEAIRSGVPFKIVIADDNNDPNRAVAIANALVQDNSVLAVIGHGTSKTTLAAAPIYQQHQMVMIAPTSTSTELAQIPRGAGGNFIFRTIASDQFTGTTLARHMLSTGKRRAAVFYNSASSYSKSLQQAFATTLSLEGGEVVQEIDLAQGNATAQLSGSKADAIVLLPDAETLTQALEVAKTNANRLPLLAGDAFYRIESLQQGGQALNGLILPVQWHPLKSSNPQFAQAGSKLWGGDVNWRSAMGYDALQTLRAARSAGNISPTSGVQGRVAFAQALSGSNFTANGATEAIRFLPSGDRNGTIVLVKVQPGSRSGTGYDFVPLK